jgi:peptidoglycan glycosyltransferase
VNAPLRKVAVAVFVLLGLLFANLNYWQFYKGKELRTDELNRRSLEADYDRQRGSIVVEGTAVALSKEVDNNNLKYQRFYPAKGLYAHLTGYKAPFFGATGVERAENLLLSGEDDRLFVRRLSDLVTGAKPEGGDVVLTVDKELQTEAYDQLGDQKGSAVLLDPRTGAILAMAANPTFDPNPLVVNDADAEASANKALQADPDKPAENRAIVRAYPPGSTFKVIMAAAALENGIGPDTPLEGPAAYTPPQTSTPIENFTKGVPCDQGRPSLERSLTISCNTSFARLGAETLGADKIKEKAKDFGFSDDDLRIPQKVAPSVTGDMPDPPSTAQSSIGQRDVRMTPLQGAMIAASVANNGVMMKPHLVKEVRAPDLSVLDRYDGEELRRSIGPDTAGDLRTMMESVVEKGTGTKAQVDGLKVGGKTGTAQDGERPEHTWFIGYAMKDGEPLAAVCVMLENTGGSSSVATEIAGNLLRVAFQQGGRK